MAPFLFHGQQTPRILFVSFLTPGSSKDCDVSSQTIETNKTIYLMISVLLLRASYFLPVYSTCCSSCSPVTIPYHMNGRYNTLLFMIQVIL